VFELEEVSCNANIGETEEESTTRGSIKIVYARLA
jgi:hypothetical protein